MDFDKNNQLIFNNKRYYFDVERISKFINHSDTHKIMEREIIDSFADYEATAHSHWSCVPDDSESPLRCGYCR